MEKAKIKKNSLRVGLVIREIIGILLFLQNLNPVAMGEGVPDNLALRGTLSVSSVHEGRPELNATKLNDGLYGTDNSWIGGLSDYVDPVTQNQFSHQEHPGSDYNKFIGNVIQGIVTTVIMVGPHSSSDIEKQGKER